jgi:hypothetical protein
MSSERTTPRLSSLSTSTRLSFLSSLDSLSSERVAFTDATLQVGSTNVLDRFTEAQSPSLPVASQERSVRRPFVPPKAEAMSASLPESESRPVTLFFIATQKPCACFEVTKTRRPETAHKRNFWATLLATSLKTMFLDEFLRYLNVRSPFWVGRDC